MPLSAAVDGTYAWRGMQVIDSMQGALCLLGPMGLIGLNVLFLGSRRDIHRFMEIVRERHTALWVSEGRPWFTLTGPRPLRSAAEQRFEGRPDQPWPSWRWLFRSIRRLPEELRGDPEVEEIHRRLLPRLRWFYVLGPIVLLAWIAFVLSVYLREA